MCLCVRLCVRLCYGLGVLQRLCMYILQLGYPARTLIFSLPLFTLVAELQPEVPQRHGRGRTAPGPD